MPAQELPLPSPAPAMGKMPRPGDAVASDTGVYSTSSGAPHSLRGKKQDLVCNLWESPLTPQGARGLRLIPSLLARGAGLCLEMLHEIRLCRATSACGSSAGWGLTRSNLCLGSPQAAVIAAWVLVFLITRNMRSLPGRAEGLLANITSHLPGFEGL